MSFPLFKNSVSMPWSFNRFSLPKPIYSLDQLMKINESDSNTICLTFDDGPDPMYTPRILALLKDHGVKATFFVMGEAVEQYPHLFEQILKDGHAIGNHTYSHRHPWMVSSQQAKEEVTRTTEVIKNLSGIKLRWFRPPFGRLRKAMRQQVQSEKMSTVLWNHSIIDWGFLGTHAGISQRLDQIKTGDIVLMHDGKREHNHPEIMLECLPDFLRSLNERELITASLDEYTLS